MWRFQNNKWYKRLFEEEAQLISSSCHRHAENSGISSFNLPLNVKFEDSQLWSKYLQLILWKRFSKNVCKLIFRFTKFKKNKFLLDKLYNEVMSNVNMFASAMENWILCHADSTLITAINFDGFTYFHSQFFHQPWQPNGLCACGWCNKILCFCCR